MPELECTICQETVVDEIKMTCPASHSFCFKCILKDVETNSILKPCPNCQTGLKYILILNRSKISSFKIQTSERQSHSPILTYQNYHNNLDNFHISMYCEDQMKID